MIVFSGAVCDSDVLLILNQQSKIAMSHCPMMMI